MEMIPRLSSLLLSILGAFWIASLGAQGYPSKPIRLILPQTPATGIDLILRKANEAIQPRLGQPMVVAYHPGANQMVGAELCAKAAPDGYTLCSLSVDPLAVNPHIFFTLPYDPIRDFKPVTSLHYIVSGWFAKASLPANSIQELQALAVAKPGQLNWATLGPRTNTDITRIWLNEKWKTRIEGVPYKGGAPIMNALIAGEVDFTVQGVYMGIGLIKERKAKLLAVARSKRLAIFPDVPTLKELGLGDAPQPWWGLVMPAGTPDAVVRRINAEFVQTFRDPKFVEFLDSQATESNVGTPEQFAALIRTDYEKFGQMVKRFNIPRQ